MGVHEYMQIVLNLPNALTLFRVISVPLFIYLLVQPEMWPRQLAFGIFVLSSLTDLLDGYFARKYAQETEFGRFLDPLADKILAAGALLSFLALSEQVQLWMVLAILGRDILISILRYLAIKKGSSLRTSAFSKFKTAFQMIGILCILTGLLLLSYKESFRINEMYKQEKENYGLGTWKVAFSNMESFFAGTLLREDLAFALASFLPYFVMLIMTLLSLVSGLRYLYSNYALLLPPYPAVLPSSWRTKKSPS